MNPAWVGRRWVKALCSAPVVLLGSPDAVSADDTHWLDWPTFDECPSANDIERRVVELLNAPLPRGLRVQTRLRQVEEQWEVSVDIALSGNTGRRTVSLPTCLQAADFVAVAVALAVEPGSPGGVTPTDPEVSAPSSGAGRASFPGPEDAAVDGSVDGSSNDPPWLRRPHVSAVLESSVWILPQPSLGVGLSIGGDVGDVIVTVGGRWLPAVATSVPEAVAPIEFSLVAGRIAAGYVVSGVGLRGAPTVSIEGGVVASEQEGAPGSRVRHPWLTVGIGARGELELGARFSLLAEAELVAPLLRPRFELDDGTLVHVVGLGLRAVVGGQIYLTGQ